MWLAKSFLIKLNLMLPNAEALGLFGFILLQIALQTPLLLLLTTTSNQQRQRQGQGQKQRQRQRQSQRQGSYRVRAGQASVRVRASPTTNANELQNAMQCMHKKWKRLNCRRDAACPNPFLFLLFVSAVLRAIAIKYPPRLPSASLQIWLNIVNAKSLLRAQWACFQLHLQRGRGRYREAQGQLENATPRDPSTRPRPATAPAPKWANKMPFAEPHLKVSLTVWLLL